MKIHRDFILDRLRLIRVLKFFFIGKFSIEVQKSEGVSGLIIYT